ncbi:MAG: hypothetical protein ACLPXB_02525 [Thiobacillaceae bacterium]
MKKALCVLALIVLATTMGYSKEKHVKPTKQFAKSASSNFDKSNSREKEIFRNQAAPILSRVE